MSVRCAWKTQQTQTHTQISHDTCSFHSIVCAAAASLVYYYRAHHRRGPTPRRGGGVVRVAFPRSLSFLHSVLRLHFQPLGSIQLLFLLLLMLMTHTIPSARSHTHTHTRSVPHAAVVIIINTMRAFIAHVNHTHTHTHGKHLPFLLHNKCPAIFFVAHCSTTFSRLAATQNIPPISSLSHTFLHV